MRCEAWSKMFLLLYIALVRSVEIPLKDFVHTNVEGTRNLLDTSTSKIPSSFSTYIFPGCKATRAFLVRDQQAYG